ncbi:Serine carboxypeptidase-like 20 [Bienertia sinuspersici]
MKVMNFYHHYFYFHQYSVICMVILITLFTNYPDLIIITDAAPANSLITQLPGFSGTFPSNHYSGYITIHGHSSNQQTPKNLFYYFVESERNPTKDPVVLWLNGGPGCSSFDGFIYEHGPFNFQAGKTKNSLPLLHLNPYSWSKVSNIIYLDSPTGVGLSYSDNQTTYQTGDLQTARDTHTFLLQWFRQFPEFIKNHFYVAGESYGGIYVPTLAAKLAEGLNDKKVSPIINFKGYMIGNGVTAEQKYDGNALLPFAHGMALISDGLYRAIEGLNIYDILEPCYHNPENEKTKNLSLPESFKQLGVTERHLPVRKRMYGRAWPFKMVIKDGLVPSGDHDLCVPYTGTQAWTSSLGYQVLDEWRPWLSNDQVAGYVQAYEHNLTFITIKGAGHTVPEYKPREAFDLYSRWLEGKPI